MIAERYPELEALSPSEQLELAAELASRASQEKHIPDLTTRSVEILESRLDYYLAHPETGIDWEELRKQKSE